MTLETRRGAGAARTLAAVGAVCLLLAHLGAGEHHLGGQNGKGTSTSTFTIRFRFRFEFTSVSAVASTVQRKLHATVTGRLRIASIPFAIHTRVHTYAHIYVYLHISVCVCACMCELRECRGCCPAAASVLCYVFNDTRGEYEAYFL